MPPIAIGFRYDLPMPSPAEMIRALETELLSAATRSDAARLADIFHPDIVELGASGRRWDHTGLIEALLAEARDDGTRRSLDCFELATIAPGVLLAQYDATQINPAGRVTRSRRSSIWIEVAPDRWQLRFHQGTPL